MVANAGVYGMRQLAKLGVVISRDAVTDNAAIILHGSANFVMAAADCLTLTMFNDQIWEETARKVNL